MKRSSSTASKGGYAQKDEHRYNKEVAIDWEMRPGGLLVQKRCDESSADASNTAGPMIKIKVSHDSYRHDITVPAHSTFGDLKRLLAYETGLEAKDQRLLFRGKEKEDSELLHISGVKDMSKLVLLEDPASKERKLQEMRSNEGTLRAYEAVAKVRAVVDRLSEKVVALGEAVNNGMKVVDKEFVVLTELLMVQLLKLDSIDADGEARVQRRIEVRRVQSFVDTVDRLKAINCNPFNNGSNAVSAATKWETIDSGFGNLTAPYSSPTSSTKITQDWELFD